MSAKPKSKTTKSSKTPEQEEATLPTSRNIKQSIQAVPTWFKQRPAAVTSWKKADKKKKKYRSFRLQKKIKPEPRYIPSSIKLLKESFQFISRHKRIFLTMIAIHGLIYVAIVRSPVATDIQTIQDSVETVIGSKTSLESNLATLGAVVGSTGTSQNSAATASIAVIVISLVYIWAIRQLHSAKTITARDAFYQGPTPLLSSLVVLVIATLQLIPFAVASFVYSTARSNSLFVSGFEDLAFFFVTLLISLLSFYWLTSTVIALYIVTLPGMYPLAALKAAKKLVHFQRAVVFRRMLTLPIILSLLYFAVLLGIIRFFPNQTFIIVEVVQLFILPLVHVYFYKLYRALI